jgi:hypothetical protein
MDAAIGNEDPHIGNEQFWGCCLEMAKCLRRAPLPSGVDPEHPHPHPHPPTPPQPDLPDSVDTAADVVLAALLAHVYGPGKI